MKIRLSPEQIRVRIDRLEAAEWLRSNTLKLCIPWPENPVEFELLLHPKEQWELSSPSPHLRSIVIPYSIVENWLNGEQESIDCKLPALKISIEKDYPCEHKLSEDDRTFTRPHDTQR
jgi:hypothetical protein